MTNTMIRRAKDYSHHHEKREIWAPMFVDWAQEKFLPLSLAISVGQWQ